MEPKFENFVLNDINPLSGARKRRIISVPNEAMREIHESIIRRLREVSRFSKYATGALPGSSILKNAARHRNAMYMYLLDLHDAYGSVDEIELTKWFSTLCIFGHDPTPPDDDYDDDWVYEHLEEWCLSETGGLVVGAPASPDIFNTYASWALDNKMGHFADRHEITYTRYLDDLAFSSRNPIGRKKRRMINRIIADAGFQVSHRKARLYDLGKGPAFMNGVGIEFGGRLFLPRPYLRKIRGFIHRATFDKKDAARVNGMMGVFRSIYPDDKALRTQSERKLVEEYRSFSAAAKAAAMRARH